MPQKGWICPIERTEVPWDHFDHCTALRGRSAWPPWLARYVEQKIVNDVRHAGHNLTTTRTMSCPREVYIKAHFDYYSEPNEMMAADLGTVQHEVAANAFNPEVFYTEANDKMRMNMKATFFKDTAYEVELDMLADAIRKDLTEIIDLKFPKDWSIKWRRQDHGRAKDDHRVQLNLLRLALAQQQWALDDGYDKDAVRLTIWDHAIGDGKEGPEPMVGDPHGGLVKVAYMEEDDILRHRPAGGEWTIGDIISVFLAINDAAKEPGVTHEKIAASIPLVGEAMFNKKKCQSYCGVEKICSKLVRVYGRPEEVEDGQLDQG